MSLDYPFVEGSDSRWNVDAVIRDYRIGVRSRQASLLASGEVFSGKAKFGIFGSGKETAQLALAYVFRKGDFRSGYYRDQTIMFALDLLTVEQFFAQLYAHADPVAEPSSAGRSMTSHFATRFLDAEGRFESQVDRYNSSADLSPTGAQMPRLVGLAYASKLYRQVRTFDQFAGKFSDRGNEIAFGTIGNASCAEGVFWESVNAAGVLQIPMLLSIWDDGFGISVPNSFQMTKGDISRILEGFRYREGGRPGLSIYVARGWNYAELCSTYLEASEIVRRDHTPAMIHVTELTQPQGHSTSGNHERYKSPNRLAWEREYDCLVKMREWILEAGFASERELDAIETAERDRAVEARDNAWRAYRAPIEEERGRAVALIRTIEKGVAAKDRIAHLRQSLEEDDMPLRRDIMAAVAEVLLAARDEPPDRTAALRKWKAVEDEANRRRYGSDCTASPGNPRWRRPSFPSGIPSAPDMHKGFEIINHCFDAAFERIPKSDCGWRRRRATGRRESGMGPPPGEIRGGTRVGHGHSRSHHHRPGDRHGPSRFAAHCRDSVSGLHPVRVADHFGRSGDVAVAHPGRPESPGDYPDPRASARRDLAFRVAHVGDCRPVAWPLRLRAPEFGPGGGFLQHAVSVR